MEDCDRTSNARITQLELGCGRNHETAFLGSRSQLFGPEGKRRWEFALEFWGNWTGFEQLSQRNWQNGPRDDRRDCIPDQIAEYRNRGTCHDPDIQAPAREVVSARKDETPDRIVILQAQGDGDQRTP